MHPTLPPGERVFRRLQGIRNNIPDTLQMSQERLEIQVETRPVNLTPSAQASETMAGAITAMSEELRSHRSLLQSTAQRAWDSYDNALLILSGGAIGLSVAVLKDVIGNKPIIALCLLILAWLSWILSLAALLLSHFCGAKANQYAVSQLDTNTEATGGSWNTITGICNPTSGILFLFGVIFFVLFVTLNL